VWCPFCIGRREMSQALASQVLELALVKAAIGFLCRLPSDR
jgi:hypothetical protein